MPLEFFLVEMLHSYNEDQESMIYIGFTTNGHAFGHELVRPKNRQLQIKMIKDINARHDDFIILEHRYSITMNSHGYKVLQCHFGSDQTTCFNKRGNTYIYI